MNQSLTQNLLVIVSPKSKIVLFFLNKFKVSVFKQHVLVTQNYTDSHESQNGFNHRLKWYNLFLRKYVQSLNSGRTRSVGNWWLLKGKSCFDWPKSLNFKFDNLLRSMVHFWWTKSYQVGETAKSKNRYHCLVLMNFLRFQFWLDTFTSVQSSCS